MKSKVSAISAKELLKKRLGEDSSILKDLGQITNFCSCIVLATSNPVTLWYAATEILKTAGSCISLCQNIQKKFQNSETELAPLIKYDTEKFDILFYVLCLRSYFEAIERVFKEESVKDVKTCRRPSKFYKEETIFRIQSIISKIEETEIHYFLSVDPVSLNIPLYAIYGEWLDKIIRWTGDGEIDSQKVIKKISDRAKKILHLKISKSTIEEYIWIRNFLLIKSHIKFERKQSELIDNSKNIQDTIFEIKEILEGWLNENSQRSTNRNIQPWTEYRNKLKKLPDKKDSMFNEVFGVRKVFVSPMVRYYRQGYREISSNERSLSDILGGLLSSRTTNEDLIFLCGGPGSGKSTICRCLADKLAQHKNVHPILVKLRSLKHCNNVSKFIEYNLKKDYLIDSIKDLRDLENVILILDGFDEVVMANRDKLNILFTQLKEELQTYPFKETKIVIAGRDTLFPNGDGFPNNSHIVELLPFDKIRVCEWAKKWNRTPHRGINKKEFNPETHLESKKNNELRNLIFWPLTLHLVARIHSAGYIDLSKQLDIEKAFIYKYILFDTIDRQRGKKREENDKARLHKKELKQFLRYIAWYMYSAGKDIIDIKVVQNILKNKKFTNEDNKIEQLAETAVLNAPSLKKGEEVGVEFIHKSFSEYLAAEMIAQIVELISETKNNTIAGQICFILSDLEAMRRLIMILCNRSITDEIIDYLTPMLGNYSEFKKTEPYTATILTVGQTKKIEILIKRLKKLYSKSVMDEAFFTSALSLNTNYQGDDFRARRIFIIGLVKLLSILHLTLNRKFYIYYGNVRRNNLNAVLFEDIKQIHDSNLACMQKTLIAIPNAEDVDKKITYIDFLAEDLSETVPINLYRPETYKLRMIKGQHTLLRSKACMLYLSKIQYTEEIATHQTLSTIMSQSKKILQTLIEPIMALVLSEKFDQRQSIKIPEIDYDITRCNTYNAMQTIIHSLEVLLENINELKNIQKGGDRGQAFRCIDTISIVVSELIAEYKTISVADIWSEKKLIESYGGD